VNEAAPRIGGLVGVVGGAAFATAFHMFGAGFWTCVIVFIVLGWFIGTGAYVLSLDAADECGRPRPEDRREPFVGGFSSAPDVDRRFRRWTR
jgi:hypothetical protein